MKQLRLPIIMLLLAGLFTMVSSYAWISLATVNKIVDIRLNAISENKMEISLDGMNYYEVIPKEAILPELQNINFKDITSMDGLNFVIRYDNDEAPIPNKDYLSIDFYFRTKTRYIEVHLADLVENVPFNNTPELGTYITSRGRNFRAPFDYQYGQDELVLKGDIRTYYAKDAMRVSFYNYHSDTTKIFDLSGNEERGFGKTYGMLDYYKHRKGITLIPPTGPDTIYQLSELEENAPYAITYDSHLITLEKESGEYYTGKVKMNVWLEGWDADSIDAIYDDELKLQFMFRAVRTKL